MKTENSSSAWWIRGSVLVVAFAAMVALAWGLHVGPGPASKKQSVSTEQTRNEISQMTSYSKQGRYDDAVRLGLELVKNDPTDEIVYQQIADVYLIRAQKDHEQREEWVKKAIFYIEKSLSFNSKDKDTAGVYIF